MMMAHPLSSRLDTIQILPLEPSVYKQPMPEGVVVPDSGLPFLWLQACEKAFAKKYYVQITEQLKFPTLGRDVQRFWS